MRNTCTDFLDPSVISDVSSGSQFSTFNNINIIYCVTQLEIQCEPCSHKYSGIGSAAVRQGGGKVGMREEPCVSGDCDCSGAVDKNN